LRNSNIKSILSKSSGLPGPGIVDQDLGDLLIEMQKKQHGRVGLLDASDLAHALGEEGIPAVFDGDGTGTDFDGEKRDRLVFTSTGGTEKLTSVPR
jgi:hypothetical protein